MPIITNDTLKSWVDILVVRINRMRWYEDSDDLEDMVNDMLSHLETEE